MQQQATTTETIGSLRGPRGPKSFLVILRQLVHQKVSAKCKQKNHSDKDKPIDYQHLHLLVNAVAGGGDPVLVDEGAATPVGRGEADEGSPAHRDLDRDTGH